MEPLGLAPLGTLSHWKVTHNDIVWIHKDHWWPELFNTEYDKFLSLIMLNNTRQCTLLELDVLGKGALFDLPVRTSKGRFC